jgi:hypothetical protein
VQRQGVGVVQTGRGAGLVERHGAGAIGEQARQVGDGLRVGQDVGIEDFLRDHQHEAAVAGDHVGDDTVAGEQRHHAEDVAGTQLADHAARAGVVGHRDFSMAADQTPIKLAFVAGFEDGFVASKVARRDLMTISSTLSAVKVSNRRTCSRKKRFRSISLMLFLALMRNFMA